MAWSVEGVLRSVYPRVAAGSRRLEGRVRAAMWRILRCGSGELGTYVRRCPEGCFAEVGAQSCRHRSCPKCRGRKVAQWLEGWLRRLLPVVHFHVVFTVPSEFHPLWRFNRKAMARLLFRCARDTLIELLADPVHLGATPGILMVLHTWSRALALHPHVHCLVTGGGVDDEGRWKASEEFLVPIGVLRKVFRGKFTEAILLGWRDRALDLPPDWTEGTLQVAIGRARRKKWSVRIEPPYRHGMGVVKYLAQYVCGGPIGSKRIAAFDGERIELVVGREKTNPATVTLTAEEFMLRWGEHIPERGLHAVRAYGLYASAKRRLREQCREQIGASDTEPDTTPQIEVATHCPICAAELVVETLAAPRRRTHLPPARAPAERLAA